MTRSHFYHAQSMNHISLNKDQVLGYKARLDPKDEVTWNDSMTLCLWKHCAEQYYIMFCRCNNLAEKI